MQLLDLFCLGTGQNVKLADLFLGILVLVVEHIVSLQYAGIDLDQRIFSDKRIHDRLEHIRRLRLGEIEVRLKGLIGLRIDTRAAAVFRRRQVLDHIDHHRKHAAAERIGAHQHRHDRALRHICAERLTDLVLGKLLAAEVTIHKLFAGLRHGFHQCFPAELQILLGVIRYVARLHRPVVLPRLGALLDDIDITDKLSVLADRQMERRDLFAVQLLQILDDLTEGCVIDIHLGHEDHARQMVLLTDLPRAARTALHSVLAGNDDDRSIRGGSRFLYLAQEIQRSRRIQNVDLAVIPRDRDHACVDRNLACLLLLVKITDRIALCGLARTVRHPCQIGHCLYERCLAAAGMSEQGNIADFVGCVNFHISFPPRYKFKNR